MKKPVLFLIFSRPETTFPVFEAIRSYRPEELFIAADGPRPGVPSDPPRCAEARKVAGMIDWPCRVHTLFRETNLGCRYAPSGAIDWFFQHVEEGIVLEDDIMPSPDFFRFCEIMLEKFRDNERIMHVAGMSFQKGIRRGEYSCFFSIFANIWGLATWRRAWRHYQADMDSFPGFRASDRMAEIFPGRPYAQWRYTRLFLKTFEKSPWFNTWDYQWTYTLFRKNGLAVVPNGNLVSNIGGSGTHPVSSNLCGTALEPLPDPVTIPPELKPDKAADDFYFRSVQKGDWRDFVRYALSRITFSDWM